MLTIFGAQVTDGHILVFIVPDAVTGNMPNNWLVRNPGELEVYIDQ